MPQTINTPDGLGAILGSFSICLNEVDLGLSNGGVTISQSNTYEDLTGDQTVSLLGKFVTQRIYTITVNMRDQPLNKMRAYLGQARASLNADGTGLCVVEAGSCARPEEFSLTIKGPGPDCGCRNYHFPRVLITPSQIDQVISRDSISEIAVEFTAIPQTDGLVYCISDTCDQIIAEIDAAGAPRAPVAITCDDTVPLPA